MNNKMIDDRPMIIQCQSCLTVYDANSSRGFRIDRCPKCGDYNWESLYQKGKEMTRSETTKFLSDLLIRDRLSGIGKYYASEVSLDWGQGKGKEKRIDFLQFSPKSQLCVGDIEKGIFTCYEIKSCKEDVFSGNGLNFIGEKNYIVTTMECWKDIMGDLGKLQEHIKNCNPESSHYFGIMVARPFPRSLTDEFENPTPLESDVYWTLEVIKPCRESYRRRSMSELLFYMLRSGR